MKKIVLIFGCIALLMACSSNDDKGSNTNTYDRSALLTNWADNIIIPAYENYQAKLQLVVSSTTTFTTTPTTANLQDLRASWLDAYKAYQYAAMYDFGKAEAVSLKQSANTYPTDAAGIEANIAGAQSAYNLALQAQFSKQGFPGLDYLINGLGANDDLILAFYTSNTNAANYKAYLIAVATRLKTNADSIVNDWNGGFRDSYIANNGTSVGSSVNVTTNNFVKSYEKDIRYAKVGIPAGLFSAGVTFPEKVEGYYKADVAKILLNTSVQAAQDFFNGKHFDSATTGEGLKSYLDYLNADRDGQKLSTIINNQFATIYETNATLNDNFSEQIFTDNSKMVLAYDSLQKNVVYTKLDMMQALNITIDYVDGDGD